MADLTLSSPAFGDGEPIPEKYGYTNENVNPPLAIDGVPDDGASLALVVDDPDAVEPAGKVWDHWLVWNIDPGRQEIPEAWDAGSAGAVEGQNDYGEHGYGGPNPPDGEHTYRFRLYAVDSTLDLGPSASKDDLDDSITGRILDRSALTGTYTP